MHEKYGNNSSLCQFISIMVCDRIEASKKEILKMTKYKDGWHKINGYQVYVEDGNVIWGTLNRGGDITTAYVYKFSKAFNCYCKVNRIKADTFRRGKYVLM